MPQVVSPFAQQQNRSLKRAFNSSSSRLPHRSLVSTSNHSLFPDYDGGGAGWAKKQAEEEEGWFV
jgi:hypothetical protein